MDGEAPEADASFHADLCLLAEPDRVWFSIFSRDVLKGGVWKSKVYIKKYNAERARSFQWTSAGKPLTLESSNL